MSLAEHLLPGLLLTTALSLQGCNRQPEPEPTQSSAKKADQQPTEDAKKQRMKEAAERMQERRKKQLKQNIMKNKLAAKPVAKVQPTPGDPENGEFTLDEATKGLGSVGGLVATIHTDRGNLTCELYEDRAPITVANFVGLARGLRPWMKDGKWAKVPLYNGTTFHRIIKGFMIQGGDPNKNGSGGPGYVIPDEIWENARHDTRGLLCMANRGANTNGSQFFIMDGSAPHLDGGYTIFGKCSPDSVIEKIAAVNVRGPNKEAAPVIQGITVLRDPRIPKPVATASSSAPGSQTAAPTTPSRPNAAVHKGATAPATPSASATP